ncbi:hypothetical protein D3C72_2495030 [compost metagenome]
MLLNCSCGVIRWVTVRFSVSVTVADGGVPIDPGGSPCCWVFLLKLKLTDVPPQFPFACAWSWVDW